jgi:hypothetical protein
MCCFNIGGGQADNGRAKISTPTTHAETKNMKTLHRFMDYLPVWFASIRKNFKPHIHWVSSMQVHMIAVNTLQAGLRAVRSHSSLDNFAPAEYALKHKTAGLRNRKI